MNSAMMVPQVSTISNLRNLPPELQEGKNKVNYHLVDRGAKKLTKVPKNPRTLQNASVNNPSSHGTLEEAMAAVAAHPDKASGVGHVLTRDAGLAVADLDNCRNPESGELAPWAQAIVDIFDSYTEISPSGTGVHIWVKGTPPETGNRQGDVEMYGPGDGRYMTLTGVPLPGCRPTIEHRQAELEQVHRQFLTKPNKAAAQAHAEDVVIGEGVPPSRTISSDGIVSYRAELSDDDVLRIGMRSANGEKFRRVYNGDNLGKSPSEGDAAFLGMLVFITRNREQIERIARNSPRARDKWNEPRRDTTWLGDEITKALALVTNHYDPNYSSGASDYNPDIIPAHEGVTTRRRRFVLEQPRDLFNRPRPRWVIDGVFVEDSLALGAAPPSSFKSFIGLDCALSVAMGKDWHGRGVQQAPVVYINAEGNGKVLDRISAWGIANDIDLSGDVPIYFIGTAPQLLDQGDVSDLLAAIAELPTPPGFIVIDTVARSLVGGEENSARDMGLFVAGMDALRKATGAAVFAIHHVNKATGEARGSTALTGAMDTIIRLDRNGPTVALTCTKQKDAEEFKPIHLAARRIEIDEDRESLVFDEVARADSPGKPVTNATQLKVIEELLLRPGVGHNVWRDACKEKAGIPFSTFKLAKDALKTQGLVRQESERGPYTVTDLGRSFMLANGAGPA